MGAANQAGENGSVQDECRVGASRQDKVNGHDEYGIQYQSARLLSNRDSLAQEEHGKCGAYK